MANEVVRAWLATVETDLKAIRNCLHGPEPTSLGAAYHCQQAAEKLVKAVLVAAGTHPWKSHDIHALIDALDKSHPLRPRLTPLERFTPYVWAFRYPSPGPMEPPPPEPSLGDIRRWLGEIEGAKADVEQHLGIV